MTSEDRKKRFNAIIASLEKTLKNTKGENKGKEALLKFLETYGSMKAGNASVLAFLSSEEEAFAQ